MEKSVYQAPVGLLIALRDVEIPAPRILPMSLSSLLWPR